MLLKLRLVGGFYHQLGTGTVLVLYWVLHVNRYSYNKKPSLPVESEPPEVTQWGALSEPPRFSTVVTSTLIFKFVHHVTSESLTKPESIFWRHLSFGCWSSCWHVIGCWLASQSPTQCGDLWPEVPDREAICSVCTCLFVLPAAWPLPLWLQQVVQQQLNPGGHRWKYISPQQLSTVRRTSCSWEK